MIYQLNYIKKIKGVREMKILDVFSGHLSTWIDKDFARNYVIKNDIRNGEIDVLGFQKINIETDFNYNMFQKDLIIDGGNFDLIYADPPHLVDVSEKSIMHIKYTSLKTYMITSLEIDIINMLNNLYNNLKYNGICIIKWNNKDIKLKEYIKEHTKFQLLFGSTTNKKTFTEYITMTKIKEIENE